MIGPSKSRPPMSHRKTDLGIPCRSKSAKVVLAQHLRDAQRWNGYVRKITPAIGGKRVRVLLIHEIGELGVGDAPHFRQAADRARKRLERLVVGAASITHKMVPDVKRRPVSGIVAFEVLKVRL